MGVHKISSKVKGGSYAHNGGMQLNIAWYARPVAYKNSFRLFVPNYFNDHNLIPYSFTRSCSNYDFTLHSERVKQVSKRLFKTFLMCALCKGLSIFTWT